MLTEDEAKTKRCCGAYDCGERRVMAGEVIERYCIGSACMAWREDLWTDTRQQHLYSTKTGKRVTSAPSSESEWRLANPDEPAPPKRGWCGLVERPAQ